APKGDPMNRLFVAAAAGLVACGGSSATTTPGESSNCTVALSGALTDSFDCKPATTLCTSGSNTCAFSFKIFGTGTKPSLEVVIGFPNEPHTGTYKNPDAASSAFIFLSNGTGQYWAARVNIGANSNDASYTLNI